MKEALVPAIYDKSKLDDIIMIDTEEAYRMSREIVRKEGIFCRYERRGGDAGGKKSLHKHQIRQYRNNLPGSGRKVFEHRFVLVF
jgi:hypothetical protein